MSHAKLIRTMKSTMLMMCHASARLKELEHKAKSNEKSLTQETVASRTVYVVELDRALNRLEFKT